VLPSIHAIARDLGGKVRGDHVVAPGPGQKRGDRSLSVWVNPNGETRVHSHRGDDWRVCQAHVRKRCGLAPWTPTRTKQATWRAPHFERNHYVSECLRIARSRTCITVAQFAILVNDLKNAGNEARGWRYACEFGFTDAELERALEPRPRTYTADERAAIFEITYAERMELKLRRTGSVDVDKQGRERARRDRDNAKRRAKRASSRKTKANVPSIEVSSSQRVIAVGIDRASSDRAEQEGNSDLVVKERVKGGRVSEREGSKGTENRQSSHQDLGPESQTVSASAPRQLIVSLTAEPVGVAGSAAKLGLTLSPERAPAIPTRSAPIGPWRHPRKRLSCRAPPLPGKYMRSPSARA
jgi:hypothetical protein